MKVGSGVLLLSLNTLGIPSFFPFRLCIEVIYLALRKYFSYQLVFSPSHHRLTSLYTLLTQTNSGRRIICKRRIQGISHQCHVFSHFSFDDTTTYPESNLSSLACLANTLVLSFGYAAPYLTRSAKKSLAMIMLGIEEDQLPYIFTR